MSFEIQIDADSFERELGEYAGNLDAAAKAAVSEATQSYHGTSKAGLIKDVYQPEIPSVAEVYEERLKAQGKQRVRPRRGGSGNAWQRRYALKNGETFTISNAGKTGQIFTKPDSKAAAPITNWPGGYGQKRHESTKRPTRWRAKALVTGRDNAIRRLRAAFKARIHR